MFEKQVNKFGIRSKNINRIKHQDENNQRNQMSHTWRSFDHGWTARHCAGSGRARRSARSSLHAKRTGKPPHGRPRAKRPFAGCPRARG
jgi:hypothetical protein